MEVRFYSLFYVMKTIFSFQKKARNSNYLEGSGGEGGGRGDRDGEHM